MNSVKLKSLKLSDLKVTPTQQKQSYVFIKANGEAIGDSPNADGTITNLPNGGFANLIRKITVNSDESKLEKGFSNKNCIFLMVSS